jgi:hypothetical protein
MTAARGSSRSQTRLEVEDSILSGPSQLGGESPQYPRGAASGHASPGRTPSDANAIAWRVTDGACRPPGNRATFALLRLSSRSSRAPAAPAAGRPVSAPVRRLLATGALDRRGIPPSPARVAGTSRSPGGSIAAPFRAGALRARRLPQERWPAPRRDRCPAIGRWPRLQGRTGRPLAPGHPVTEQRSPSRGAPAARRCALAQAPPLEQ